MRLLVEEDVLGCVGTEMLHDLNTFRERFCFSEEVDKVTNSVSK